jgi:hypothetical protein
MGLHRTPVIPCRHCHSRNGYGCSLYRVHLTILFIVYRSMAVPFKAVNRARLRIFPSPRREKASEKEIKAVWLMVCDLIISIHDTLLHVGWL